jgi:hypothetical protein
MPVPSSTPSKHPTPLPSLLAHLRTSSSASIPSLSLSTDSPDSLPHSDRIRPISHLSRPSSQLSFDSTRSSSSHTARQRTVSSPSIASRQAPRRTPLRTASSSSDLRTDREDASSGGGAPLSRSSSSSSLDGLASRLQGARQGRGRGAVLPLEDGEGHQRDKGKGRAVQGQEENAASFSSSIPSTSRHRQDSYTLSSAAVSSPPSSSMGDNDVAPLAAPEDENGADSSDEDEDDASSFGFDLPSRFEGQPDPRDMLRAQLARPTPSSPISPPHRSTSQLRMDTVDGEEKAPAHIDEGRDVVRYQPRRYFVLSTAGKLVWTSCVSFSLLSFLSSRDRDVANLAVFRSSSEIPTRSKPLVLSVSCKPLSRSSPTKETRFGPSSSSSSSVPSLAFSSNLSLDTSTLGKPASPSSSNRRFT